MRWQGREGSNNVEDRRNSSGSNGSGKPIGILGLIVILVGAYYGVDLTGVVGGAPSGALNNPQTTQTRQISAQEQELAQLSLVVLRETEKVWSAYFQKHNATYPAPKMVLYRNNTPTACGTGSASAGPFYCPADQKLYIDLSFYNTMKNQLGAEGDAAFAYVLAHEVGHHVQTITGTIDKKFIVHKAASTKQPPMRCRSNWNCKPTAMRVFGATMRKKMVYLKQVMYKKPTMPPPQWAMTPYNNAHGVTPHRIPTHTAHLLNVKHGLNAA